MILFSFFSLAARPREIFFRPTLYQNPAQLRFRYHRAGGRFYVRRRGTNRRVRSAIRKWRTHSRSGRDRSGSGCGRPDASRSTSRAQRNPMLSFLLSGWFLLRTEARRFVELLFHEPPRSLDRTPLLMIHHLTWHLAKAWWLSALAFWPRRGSLPDSASDQADPRARTTGLCGMAGRAAFVPDPRGLTRTKSAPRRASRPAGPELLSRPAIRQWLDRPSRSRATVGDQGVTNSTAGSALSLDHQCDGRARCRKLHRGRLLPAQTPPWSRMQAVGLALTQPVSLWGGGRASRTGFIGLGAVALAIVRVGGVISRARRYLRGLHVCW